MTNLDSALKNRDITFLTKVSVVKAIFPVVRYRSESWTIKEAEQWRIAAFKLWPWRRLLRVPWNARRSNQSILKEINPDAGKSWKQKKGVVEDEMVSYQTVSDEIHPPVASWVQCCCILWENKLCEFKIIWINIWKAVYYAWCLK